MKKLILPLIIALSLVACSKDKGDCYWTDNSGTDWTTYPTPDQKAAFEQNCSCTMVLIEHCD